MFGVPLVTMSSSAVTSDAETTHFDLARPDDKVLLDARSLGISSAFYQHDLRNETLRGLWPGRGMVTDQVLAEKLGELGAFLVADSYGGVDAVKWARNAYNSRWVA